MRQAGHPSNGRRRSILRSARSGSRASRKYHRGVPYALVLPFFLVFLPFGAGSIVLAVGMGFLEWPLGQPATFVGLDNFSAVVPDALFHRSLFNTFAMLVGFLAIVMPLGILIAVLLQGLGRRTLNAVQVAIFVPVTMSLIAVSIVFDLLYDDQVGFLNTALQAVGLDAFPFLTDASVAPWSIIAMRVWRVLGFYAIILFGGLQSIPTDVYEAAKIDGAGWFRTLWSITLPLLKPVTLFVLVAALVGAWEVFAEPAVLTDGGPARSTYTAVMYIFEQSFGRFQLGQGAAASVVLGLLVIVSTLAASWLLRGERG